MRNLFETTQEKPEKLSLSVSEQDLATFENLLLEMERSEFLECSKRLLFAMLSIPEIRQNEPQETFDFLYIIYRFFENLKDNENEQM